MGTEGVQQIFPWKKPHNQGADSNKVLFMLLTNRASFTVKPIEVVTPGSSLTGAEDGYYPATSCCYPICLPPPQGKWSARAEDLASLYALQWAT